MGVQCFLVTATDRCKRWLRRYVSSSRATCPGGMGYHNAMVYLDTVVRPYDDVQHCWPLAPSSGVDRSDPRWPAKCEGCDYIFTADDQWQDFTRQIYRDAVTGKEYTLDEQIPGMMWYADWMGESYLGPDGHCLCVVCPGGGEWMIDGPASNCTMKEDRGPYATHHRCWVRTGEPPTVTVGKAGRTCAAGGGSIQARDYHGFLQNGVFT
jgi:hypothetical protein